jgi:hypothetical protein
MAYAEGMRYEAREVSEGGLNVLCLFA